MATEAAFVHIRDPRLANLIENNHNVTEHGLYGDNYLFDFVGFIL